VNKSNHSNTLHAKRFQTLSALRVTNGYASWLVKTCSSFTFWKTCFSPEAWKETFARFYGQLAVVDV